MISFGNDFMIFLGVISLKEILKVRMALLHSHIPCSHTHVLLL